MIPYGELAEYLEQRIALGIDKFIAALGQAFMPLPEEIHILLAGNSSRSLWISRLWGLSDDRQDALIFTRMNAHFGNDTPALHIHAPLSSNLTPRISRPPKPAWRSGCWICGLAASPKSSTIRASRAWAKPDSRLTWVAPAPDRSW